MPSIDPDHRSTNTWCGADRSAVGQMVGLHRPSLTSYQAVRPSSLTSRNHRIRAQPRPAGSSSRSGQAPGERSGQLEVGDHHGVVGHRLVPACGGDLGEGRQRSRGDRGDRGDRRPQGRRAEDVVDELAAAAEDPRRRWAPPPPDSGDASELAPPWAAAADLQRRSVGDHRPSAGC